MALFILENRVDSYTTETHQASQEEMAKQYFVEYANKVEVHESINANFVVSFEISNGYTDDGYRIHLQPNLLSFVGGKRGIIYAVFTFFEKLGFRFFTPDLEKMPTGDIYMEPFELEENSPFSFRDILSLGATDKVWSLKQKINSNLWNTRRFTEAEGGSVDMAGIPAHSLTGEFLLKPYVESHPEYFSLKNGKRITDGNGQICMTNEEAIEAATEEVFRLIEANPGKNIVSVSMGDNNNFCECEKCKAAVESEGLTRTYMATVCKIARKVKERYPHVFIHTLAYWGIGNELDWELEDNIMIHFCFGKCATHAITDKACEFNQKQSEKLKQMTAICKNVWLWYYTNCFKFELLEYPFIHNFLDNMRFYAECGATGVMNEGQHRGGDEDLDFAIAYELRSYLLAKLMWNPYMDIREYERHKVEFCEAFYGKGYPFVIQYLELYKKYAGECTGYDAHSYDADILQAVHIIREENIMDFVHEANTYLAQAMEGADETQKARIEKLKTCVLYYELYRTMRNILDHGTEDEKTVVLGKNRELIQRIFDQKLVITFWGQTKVDQDKELETMWEVPPSEWNYKW